MKSNGRLYNVIFPFWMILLFPSVVWMVLIGNFAIDSAVLLLFAVCLKVAEKKPFYTKNILKVWLFGLLADLIGSGYMFLMMSVFSVGHMGDEPYLTVPALLLSAAVIFVLNYTVTFRHCDKKIRLWAALTFAVVTAPYTFLIPTSQI